jgi:hypothetical protein
MKTHHKEFLFNAIQRQYPRWPTTFSPCITEGCEEFSRGGSECPKCLEKELAFGTDAATAKKYMELVAELRHLEIHILFDKKQNSDGLDQSRPDR